MPVYGAVLTLSQFLDDDESSTPMHGSTTFQK